MRYSTDGKDTWVRRRVAGGCGLTSLPYLCQGAINADQGGDHNRRGDAKILAREVERLHGVGALELLDRKSEPIQVHLCMRDLQMSVQGGAHLS